MLAMRFGKDSLPPMSEPDAESMPADQRAVLQAGRLRALIDRLLAAGGLQAGRLAAAGVTSGADVPLEGLSSLPTTAKRDLWEAYPFGLLAVPRDQVVAVHGSSGTGGRPTLVSYSRADIALWSKMCALVVPVSGGMTARQVTLIADLRPEILTCTPSYAIRLGEALAEAGLTRGLSLRAGVVGAEPRTQEMRARINELLGITALDIYGLSEVIGPGVASECIAAADGLHV